MYLIIINYYMDEKCLIKIYIRIWTIDRIYIWWISLEYAIMTSNVNIDCCFALESSNGAFLLYCMYFLFVGKSIM